MVKTFTFYARMPKNKQNGKKMRVPKRKPAKPKQRSRPPSGPSKVAVKPKQKPKYNVLGNAIGAVAKVLDDKYTGGIGQKIFTALTGSGDYVAEVKSHDYDIEANTVVHPTLTPTMPHITDDGGLVRVRHREFLGNILIDDQGVSFSGYALNPGNPKAFPWLSNLGNRFQQYKFLGAVAEYVTQCGNAVGNAVPALGQVNIVAQYDVSRALMTNPVERLNTYFSNSGVISADLMMAIECETTEQPCQVYNVYNQQETKSLPGDRRWYDFAEVSIQIQGAPPAATGTQYIAGQLWITYDVLLIKPVYYKQQQFVPDGLEGDEAKAAETTDALDSDIEFVRVKRSALLQAR